MEPRPSSRALGNAHPDTHLLVLHREKKLQGRKMMGNLVQTTKFDVKELRTLRAKFEEKASGETKGGTLTWPTRHDARCSDGGHTDCSDKPTSLCPDGGGLSQVDHLTKAQFCEAIVEAYPHLEGADDVNLESLFDTFDGDGGGTIDFKVRPATASMAVARGDGRVWTWQHSMLSRASHAPPPRCCVACCSVPAGVHPRHFQADQGLHD